MILADENRLLLSDSLRDVLPEMEEEQIRDVSNSIVIVALSLFGDGFVDAFAGKIIGFSKDVDDTIKLDIHTELHTAYEVIKKCTTTGLSCRNFYLRLGDNEIHFEGPFEVSSPKMFDFDQQLKMCTLGIDLIKE